MYMYNFSVDLSIYIVQFNNNKLYYSVDKFRMAVISFFYDDFYVHVLEIYTTINYILLHGYTCSLLAFIYRLLCKLSTGWCVFIYSYIHAAVIRVRMRMSHCAACHDVWSCRHCASELVHSLEQIKCGLLQHGFFQDARYFFLLLFRRGQRRQALASFF